MNKLVVNFKIITPLIMGGAYIKNPELREQSIKGLLRYWFRFYKLREKDKDMVKKIENEIWGSQENASPIRLKIIEENIKRVKVHLCMNDSRGKYNKITREAFKGSFKLEISSFFQISEEIIKTLWFLTFLGGLGARWKRGFGSVQIYLENFNSEWKFSIGSEINFERIEEFYKMHLNKIPKCITSSIGTFCLNDMEIFLLEKTEWNTWKEVMNNLRDEIYRPFKRQTPLTDISKNPKRPVSKIVFQIKKFGEKFVSTIICQKEISDVFERFIKKTNGYNYVKLYP